MKAPSFTAFWRWNTVLALIVLGLTPLALGCANSADDSTLPPWSIDSPKWGPRGRVQDPRIVEASGLVASRAYEGIYWVHNDSGDSPRLFAIDGNGSTVATIEVNGAGHVDWEDLAIDNSGNLYICDIGNNQSARQDLKIYVIHEPHPYQDTTAEVVRVLPFTFPDQERFPEPDRIFDSEAAFWYNDRLFLFTKRHYDHDSCLYALEDLYNQEGQQLRQMDCYRLSSQITAADVAADGNEVVLISYDYLYVVELGEPNEDGTPQPISVARLLFEARQSEAVVHDGDVFRVINEQREIHLLSRDAVLAGAAWVKPMPNTKEEFDERCEIMPGAPPILVEGYRPSRDEVELTPGATTALDLTKGFGEKVHALPAPPDTAQAVLNWEDGVLQLGVMWTPGPGTEGDHIMGYLGWGPASDRPWSEGEDRVCQIVTREGAVTLEHEPTAPVGAIPEHQLRWNGDRIEGWIQLAWPTDQARAFGLVLMAPGGGDWSWGGDSSMFAWLNPFLWGQVKIAR